MGRTIPTFRQLIEETLQHWSKFRRALRQEDQACFDRIFQRVRCYTQAATYQVPDNPLEAILLAIAIDQEKRLAAMERQLQQKGILDANHGMAVRPLSVSRRNDAVGDRAEPPTASTD
jgi:hypothetical protein